MRWTRIMFDGTARFARVNGERLEIIEGLPFDESYQETGESVPLQGTKLLIPVVPQTFYAAGLNYVEHIREQAEMRGEEPVLPENPDIGYRANSALIAHEDEVLIPHDATDKVQYEAELVAVIGKTAKHLTVDNALECVFGYTIGNDVSERTWQRQDRTMWRSKNTDTFKPMGPWIETGVDLGTLRTTVRVNDEVTIEFATNDMLFSLQTYMAAMTRYLTLRPGDVIWMGTEGSSPDLKDGDVVEIELNQIGVLRNRFRREGE